jgi:hypothetical protein
VRLLKIAGNQTRFGWGVAAIRPFIKLFQRGRTWDTRGQSHCRAGPGGSAVPRDRNRHIQRGGVALGRDLQLRSAPLTDIFSVSAMPAPIMGAGRTSFSHAQPFGSRLDVYSRHAASRTEPRSSLPYPVKEHGRMASSAPWVL